MTHGLSELLGDIVLDDLAGDDDDEGDTVAGDASSNDSFDFTFPNFPNLHNFLSEGDGEDDDILFSR